MEYLFAITLSLFFTFYVVPKKYKTNADKV